MKTKLFPLFLMILLVAFLPLTNAQTQPPSCVPPPSGLVLWFPGEGNAQDLSGNHHDGMLQGNVTFTAGEVGQGFNFDGASYVSIPAGIAPVGNASRTIEFWFNAQSTNPGHELFAYGDRSSGQLFGIDVDGLSANGTLQLQFFDFRDDFTIDTGLAPGQLMHFAVTYDGASALKVYINGTLIANRTIGALSTTDTEVDIGRYVSGGFFVGSIDEVDIFSRALTDAEVQGLYAAGSTGKCHPSVLIYNTGVDNSGALLRAASPDPHWSVVAPDGSTTGPFVNNFSSWVSHPPDANWISPFTDYYASGPEGDYVYSTTFTANPSDVGQIELTGRVAADNTAVVLLNGSSSGITLEGQPNYNQFTNFTVGPGANFQPGNNVLTIRVTNTFGSDPNPTGTLVEFTSGISAGSGPTPTPTPTPTATPVLTFSETGPSTPGGSIHFTATTTTGYNVRVQSSKTPTIESTWSDLIDGNSGHMTETPAKSGTYVLDTTAYPAGNAVYFRAIASKLGSTDIVSVPIGPVSLQQASLSISGKLTSTSDPINGFVTHSGDDVSFTIAFANCGSASAKNLQITARMPVYISAQSLTNAQQQFAPSAISPGGTYFPPSSPGATDAKIVWNVGDLAAPPPGQCLSNTVQFTVHISTDVRINQQLRLNDYSVSSVASPAQPFGKVIGSPSNETNVEGPISFKVTSSSGAVAPGGLFSYTFTLSNLAASGVQHAIATIVVPDFARFAPSYPNPAGKTSIPGVAYSGKKGSPAFKKIFAPGINHDQVVIDLGSLGAHPSKKGLDAVSFTITFQAQWADPAEVPTISSIDYVAAFLNSTSYAAFSSAFNTANPFNFVGFLTDPTLNLPESKDDSGVINVPVQGSLANQPKLTLLKQISETDASTEYDADGKVTNMVKPGNSLTFILGAANTGASAAEDVSISDRMPDGTVLLAAQLVRLTKVVNGKTFSADSASTTKSLPNFFFVSDPDGHHVTFQGLHLDPHDSVSVQYTVQINNGATAPPTGTILNPQSNFSAPCLDSDGSSIGSSSTPHTPCGFYISGPIEMINPVTFPQPIYRAFPSISGAVSDVNSAARQLDAIYQTNPNALPYVNSDQTQFIAGAQRYYVHYETNQSATNIDLDVPLPDHTVFYRASFVSSGNLVATPVGYSINPPAQLTNGNVNFHLSSLAANSKGDVMVEFIVTSDVIQSDRAFVGGGTSPPLITIHDGTVAATSLTTLVDGSATQSSDSVSSQLSAAQILASVGVNPLDFAIPQVKIFKVSPQEVKPGDVFQVQLCIYNDGFTPADDTVVFKIPQNAVLVSASAGNSNLFGPPQPGDKEVIAELASNNAKIDSTNSHAPLLPHSAAALTVTLRATGSIGSDIEDSSASVNVFRTDRQSAVGTVFAPPTIGSAATHIVANPSNRIVIAPFGGKLFQTTAGAGEAFLIDLGPPSLGAASNVVAAGGGNVIAAGGGNLLSSDGAGVVSQGGGNVIAAGGGNLVTAGGAPISALFANQASIIAAGGGNLIIGRGATGVIAAGGGNVIAAGAGNVIAAGAGNVVSQGGGNVVSQGGGNILATNPSSSGLVSTNGGNIIAAGGGNIIAAGGGN